MSAYYLDGRADQESELAKEHARQGHGVRVITLIQVINKAKRREYLKAGRYSNCDGIEVVRLPYHPWIPLILSKSLRLHRGVYRLLGELLREPFFFMAGVAEVVHGKCLLKNTSRS